MTFDPELAGNNNPTDGEESGQPAPQSQGTPAPQAPAERTYTKTEFDGHMANARRSWESQAQRERQAAIDAARAEIEQRYAPKPTPNDPYSAFQPEVGQSLRALLDAEWERRFAPIQQQQENLRFRNDEAEMNSRYPDYAQVRNEVLQFAIDRQIPDLEAAYRAYKFDALSQVNPEEIGKKAIADYLAKKNRQASSVPAVEGRGGGAPSTKKQKLTVEEMDLAAAELWRSSQESTA